MPNENTTHLNLPLPHPDNLLEGDVLRLRDAFAGLDRYAEQTDERLETQRAETEGILATHAGLTGDISTPGHLRLAGLAYDGTCTAAPGGFGLGEELGAQIIANTDLDTVTKPGFYSCRANATVLTLKNCPTNTAFCMLIEFAAHGPAQTIKTYNNVWFYRTKHTPDSFVPWREIPSGISNVLNGTNKSYAASEYALAQSHSQNAAAAFAAKSRADAAYDLAEKTPTSMQDKIAVGAYKDIVSVLDTTSNRIGTIRSMNEAGAHWIQLGAHNFSNGSPQGLTVKFHNDETLPRLEGPGLPIIGDFLISFNAVVPGFHICQGAAISRTTYRRLFDIIGTTFGAGNGSTTFNLPDARNKTLWGASGNLGAVLAAGLPNITGAFAVGALCGSFSGAIYNANNASTQRSTTDANSPVKAVLDASRSSPIYGKSTTVQPPSLALNVFIKY